MPLCEFECPNGHRTSALVRSDWPAPEACGRCGCALTVLPSAFSPKIGDTSLSDCDDDTAEARETHREMLEWGLACGSIGGVNEGHTPRYRHTKKDGVEAKREALKHGKKVPQRFRAIAPEGHYDAQPGSPVP